MVTRFRVIFFILIFDFTLAHAQTESRTSGINRDLFPLPPSLKPNVEFWIKVYTQYYTHQYILHDRENLDIIYEVLDIQKIFGRTDVDEKTEWEKVKMVRERYREILKKLARLKPDEIQSLDSIEKKVYDLFKNCATPERFNRAATNIRLQRGLRDRFLEGLIVSGRYIEEMKRIFREYGLPEELTILPHVESSFDIRAYSRMGAAGIWQFTRHTGRRFLEINYAVDERFDPFLSTEAAARLLKENYEELGSWPLAITAYNHGKEGMHRAKRILGTSDIGEIVEKYQSRYFGFASKNFYAEFLAALEVLQDYQSYFGPVELEPPVKYVIFEVPHYIEVSSLAKRLSLSLEEISTFNPSLRRPVLSSERRLPKGFKLRLPLRPGLNLDQLYAQLPIKEKHETQVTSHWYEVQEGDNLQMIARKLNVPIDTLLVLNEIQDPERIYVGEILKISARKEEAKQPPKVASTDLLAANTPGASESDTRKSEKSTTPQSRLATNRSAGSKVLTDREKEGAQPPKAGPTDLLAANTTGSSNSNPRPSEGPLTSSFKSATNRLMKEEIPIDKMAVNLPRVIEPDKSESLGGGREPSELLNNTVVLLEPLKYPHYEIAITSAVSESEFITVQPEETLGHLADWLQVPTQMLRKINGLRYGQDIRIGQRIKLSYVNVSPDEFKRKRMEYHRSIEEDFFANFKIEGVQIHKLKRGENIWYLSNTVYEIPYWLMFKYNAHLDLQKLKAGDEIVVPIVTAIVDNPVIELEEDTKS